MHVITLQYRRYFGSFCHLPQERHYAFHIYIRLNTWQTFINYKLMKCSAVLGDAANEDVDFFMQFDTLVTFNTILPSRSIKHHYTRVILQLTRHQTQSPVKGAA